MMNIECDTNFDWAKRMATVGAAATIDGDAHSLHIFREYFSATMSGEAEVIGAAKAIRYYADRAEKEQQAITLHLDDKYAVEVLNGKFPEAHVSAKILPFVRAAKERLARIPGATVVWVPREQNRRADRIAR